MVQKTKETIGYIVNGLSIALLFYLMFTLDVPAVWPPLTYLGWILFVLGIGLVVLSIVTLVRNQGSGLIEHGIYGLVRHPMYLGAMLLFLSFFFFQPHWLTLLISLMNVAIVYWFILLGEQQNLSIFGNAYQRYMQTVPRINLLAGIFRRMQSK
jgi:protein-S-isoprenylcysteine O-methyltransferase Ste14